MDYISVHHPLPSPPPPSPLPSPATPLDKVSCWAISSGRWEPLRKEDDKINTIESQGFHFPWSWQVNNLRIAIALFTHFDGIVTISINQVVSRSVVSYCCLIIKILRINPIDSHSRKDRAKLCLQFLDYWSSAFTWVFFHVLLLSV